MLLPRELDLVEAGKHMPLPEPKPAVQQAVAKVDAGKAATGKPNVPAVAEEPVRHARRAPEPLGRRQVHLRSKPGT